MKGKIEEIQAERNPKSGRHSVSLIVTIKKGLTYERSKELLDQLRQEYIGKMVEINQTETT